MTRTELPDGTWQVTGVDHKGREFCGGILIRERRVIGHSPILRYDLEQWLGEAKRVPMAPPLLLVTGSRTWSDPRLLKEGLMSALHELCPNRPPEHDRPLLMHGGAPGADLMAAEQWRCWGLPVLKAYRPQWQSCSSLCRGDGKCRRLRGPEEYCTNAGFARNHRMCDFGPDLVVAFIRNRSSGATDCASYAESVDLPTRRWVT